MTDTTPLSPAAQAVLKAACIHHGLFNEEIVQRRRMVAAVLRAAADQVISSVPPPYEDFDEFAQGFLAAHIKYRAEFLAIAAELEAQ